MQMLDLMKKKLYGILASFLAKDTSAFCRWDYRPSVVETELVSAGIWTAGAAQ
jgi:hypothetical protein